MADEKKKPWQFSLKQLLIAMTLICIAFAFLATYFRSPPNEISEATLNLLVERIKPGMTVAEISDVFGFDRDPLPRELGADYDGDPTWTFFLTDRIGRHGNMMFYKGEFSAGRLVKGGLWAPI